MDQKFKLLLNLEENIFHNVLKRDSLKKITTSKFQEDNNELDNLTMEYMKKALNIQMEFNEEILMIYEAKFGFTLLDIDILNLIVKYIVTCGAVLNLELSDMFGIRALDYQPKNTVKFLESQYILNKYKDGYGFGVPHTALSMFRNIFLNVIIPYASKFMIKIYAIK